MQHLSPHFTLEELTYSGTALRWGLPNTPSPTELENLVGLCVTVLEPVRALLNCPLIIDSGYRTRAVNKLVGSTAVHSDHIDGNAADFKTFGMDIRVAFKILRLSDIPFNKVIIECNSWIHISRAPTGQPLREAYLAYGRPGAWTYERVV